IKRRVEDLQLGVESYEKWLNLTKPDIDGTLNDVRNALDDRLKGIRMQYLPTTIWRRCDKDRAAAMIQAIEKMLKTKRIMINLEKFVGGRLKGLLRWSYVKLLLVTLYTKLKILDSMFDDETSCEHTKSIFVIRMLDGTPKRRDHVFNTYHLVIDVFLERPVSC
nr:hypothetical protein [Tanacetum cinerariifolium]